MFFVFFYYYFRKETCTREELSRLCKSEMFRLYKKHHIPGQCYDVLYCRQTKDSSYYELKQCSTEYQKNKEELYQHFKSKGLGAWKKQINMDSFELIWLSLNTHDLSKICISNTVICHDLEYFIHFDICWIKVVYWNTNTV